jgi:LuxR family maltose regulon positive regulatory protein
MTMSLLQTKLCVPSVRPGLVSRPRLIERLNAGLHRKLTLISAPAGFGKTTLLSEWVADCERPVAWLSLDEGDDDPARFLAYLVAALQTPALSQVEGIEPNVGEGMLSTFRAPQPPPIESLLTGLINEIADSPSPFVLVLDDYHLVTAQPVHDALTFLLDHLPDNAHLVIATRADPPLPIARLRGRGQLTELRQTDLRFTPGEVTELLDQVMGLNLSADNLAALASRTEGWIAGLQMAALALQSTRLPQATGSMQERNAERVASFIQAFTGSDRYILDYLVEEVLQRQPNSVQTFLLQTAILDRLTGPLCDAVVGEVGDWGSEVRPRAQSPISNVRSQAILEYLESSNLFIVPLDNERQWYRYHRLFADLLRSRLQEAQPDLVPTLHGRASEWYEQNELMAPAIDHALSAGDFERAAHLIEQIAEAILMRSEVVTFLNWVEALPDELVRARPTLCVFHAWALLLSGSSIDTVESRLRNVDGDTSFIGKAAPLRAFVATFQGQIRRAADLSREALEQLSEDDSFLRSIATWMLGVSHVMGGDIVAGSQALDEAARMSRQVSNVMIAVMALGSLAELHMAQGQLHKAMAIYQQARELAVDGQGQPLPIAGMTLIGLGELLREWNDLEAATHHLVEGIRLIKQWGEIGAMDGYIALARIKQAQGDADGARDMIQKAQQLAVKFDATEMDDFVVAVYQARLWIAQGNIEAAMRWIEERGLALSEACPELVEGVGGLDRDVNLTKLEESDFQVDGRLRSHEHIILARVLIAQDRPAEALALLEPLLPVLEQQRRHRRAIELQGLKALAFQAQGDVAQALAVLEHALSLAEPEDYVRIFVDEGPPMARLLYQAAARGIAPQYVGKLLAAFDLETEDERRKTMQPLSSSVPGPLSLVEPLSGRELEVLQLVAEGLSNREIAGRLFISLSTVKGHTANIYSKLAVKSRMQAVARARALGVLPDA